MGKFQKALVSILVALLLLAGGNAVAQSILVSLPINVEVIEGKIELGIYTSDLMESPVVGLNLPQSPRGESYTIPLWLRNDGVEPLIFTVVGNSTEDISISLSQIDFNLQKGETATLNATFTISDNATLGWQEVYLEFR